MKQKTQESKAQVNEIENRLTGLVKMLKNVPASDAKNNRDRNSIVEIIEHIL